LRCQLPFYSQRKENIHKIEEEKEGKKSNVIEINKNMISESNIFCQPFFSPLLSFMPYAMILGELL
jgi:hypothetical protein